MAKDKERSINPAQQQHKLEKAKALKKGKAELQARRTEKLARRNPDRLQGQVENLKALEESGRIKPREKQLLADLERDVKAIRKAREALGDKVPQFRSHGDQDRRVDTDRSTLGKRNWNGDRKAEWDCRQEESSGGETDESVKKIPMPKDTPPPIPQEYRRGRHGTHANAEPVVDGGGGGVGRGHELPSKPAIMQEARTTYEGTPQIRDLKREAIARFVPNVVRRKQGAAEGIGGLVEPEELDRLEREGYRGRRSTRTPIGLQSDTQPPATSGLGIDTPPSADAEVEERRLAEEEERFQREMRHVQIEEVEDEDL